MPLGAFKAALMGTAGVSATADVVLLGTVNADESATLAFTSAIDSTYTSYVFGFYNMHPEDDGEPLQWQVNSGYNRNITSTAIHVSHTEADNIAARAYDTASDQKNADAAYQTVFAYTAGANADDSGAGVLHLFNPSSTTHAKHFIGRMHGSCNGAYIRETLTTGYINTTAAITAISFKYASGNIDTGRIKMWGVK